MPHQLEGELQDAAAAAGAAAYEVEVEVNPDNYESALGRAIAYWQAGRYIPLTLATELMADGYDVGVLEARYLKA